MKLVELDILMLHVKTIHAGPNGFCRRILKGFTIHGVTLHLFRLFPVGLHVKFDFNWSSTFRDLFKMVGEQTTNRRTTIGKL